MMFPRSDGARVLAAASFVALFVFVALTAGSPDDGRGYLEFSTGVRPPVDEATEAATPRSAAATLPPAAPSGPVASVASPAVRGPQLQVAPTAPPPVPVAGDCLSWSAVFVWRGASAVEIEFFFADGTIQKETGCGRDLLNETTGDSGICQLNPVHGQPGWFGGREFGEGGWLHELHDLYPRLDLESLRWVDACLTLFRVCGPGPWRPPYSCADGRLP